METRVKKSYKVKLKVNTNTLQTSFKKMAGLYRSLYNQALDYQFFRVGYYVWQPSLQFMSYNRLLKAMLGTKDKNFPALKEVDGGILYAATSTASNAFRKSFDYHTSSIPYMSRKKGHMKFKTKGNIKILEDRVVIPKIGEVKFYEKNYIPINKSLHNVTFIHDGNDWFLSVEVDEDYKKEELTGAPVSLDFDKLGNIILNGKSIGNPTKSKRYLKVQRRFKKLKQKLKRQTKTNAKQRFYANPIPVTTRNMIKTKKLLDKTSTKLYNIKRDTYRKIVCEVARTKPKELHILNKSSIRKYRNNYLSRTLREMGAKELLNMMRKKLELIGADVLLYSGSNIT